MTNSSSPNCVNGSLCRTTWHPTLPYQEPEVVRVFRLLILAAVVLASLFGNFMVIKAVLEMLRKPFVYCLVTNLAVSELINIMCIPFIVSYIELSSWIYGDFMCKLIIPLQVTSSTVVTFTIAVISIRRFQIVTGKGMNFPSTRRGMWLVIFGIWLIGLAVSIPVFIYHEVVRVKQSPGKFLEFCVEMYPGDPLYVWPSETGTRYSIVRVFLCFGLPVIVMMLSYGAVTLNIKKHVRNMARSARARVDSNLSNTRVTDCYFVEAQPQGTSPVPQMVPLKDIINKSQDEKSSPEKTEIAVLLEQESDLIRMFYIIIFIFIVFYLPYQIHYLLDLFNVLRDWKYNFFLRNYMMLLSTFPSALHPLCYGTKNKFYARAFKKLVLCKC